MTRRISRNPATASGQTCIELIASALSKQLSSNGKLSTEPCRRSHDLPGEQVHSEPELAQPSPVTDQCPRHAPPPRAPTGVKSPRPVQSHLQHAIVWSDLKEVADPGAAINIHARHDDATQPTQDPLRPPKHAHQNASHKSGSVCHVERAFASECLHIETEGYGLSV